MLRYLVLSQNDNLDVAGWVGVQRLHEAIRVRLRKHHGPHILKNLFHEYVERESDPKPKAVICKNAAELASAVESLSGDPIVLTFNEDEIL